MSGRKNIDILLKQQSFSETKHDDNMVYRYAEGIAAIENCIVVVSDLKLEISRIFSGAFSDVLGVTSYTDENSIWENAILTKMTNEECNEKYLAELRFYHFLHRIPRNMRNNYYLATTLRMLNSASILIDVLHRMYYWYEHESDTIRYGICIYSPSIIRLPAKCIAVNAVTGKWEELSAASDNSILSNREKQVLSLIERGMTSQIIADELCISKNTVNRHRQEILAKLQTRNSTEACHRAKQLGII